MTPATVTDFFGDPRGLRGAREARRRGTWRYCLAQWTQEGMTAAYTFLYAV